MLLKRIAICSAKVAAALPATIAALYGLIEGSKVGGFDAADPPHYGQLKWFANLILSLSIEHWLLWILLSVALGTFWAIVAEEPRSQSKKQFDRVLNKRLNGQRGGKR